MTSNLTTTGVIQAFEVIATNELQSDGPCFLNSTLTVGGITNLNSTTNLNGAVNINKGRGYNNNGGHLKIMSSNITNDPCAISFGLNGAEAHIWEYSHLGFSHWMRLTGGDGVTWTQTAAIDRFTGRWRFYRGLLVDGTCIATAFSSSDLRLKTNLKEIPEEDAKKILKM